jgi:hypothetical protein
MIAKAAHQGQGQDTKKDQPKQLFLTSFDLTSAFFQTGLTPESSKFTAFSTKPEDSNLSGYRSGYE